MMKLRVNQLQGVDRGIIFWLRFLLSYCFLLNLPFWIAPKYLDAAPRGLFNLEYVGIGISVLFMPLWLSFAVLEFALVADVVRSATSLYYFTQNDLLSSARYTFELPLGRLAIYATMLLVPTCCLTWVALKVGPRTSKDRFVACSFAVLTACVLLVTDVANGTNYMVKVRDTRAHTKLASIPMLAFAKISYDLLRRHEKQPEMYEPMDSASSHFVLLSNGGAPLLLNSSPTSVRHRNLVLILFESLGSLRNPQQQELLKAEFKTNEVASRYEVEFGKVKFNGATVPGEFRELCGFSSAVEVPPVSALQTCLPNRLRKQGYETTALHGFVGRMFGRAEWYPEVGFSHTIFKNELKSSKGVHECEGAFVGICDADMVKVILKLEQGASNRPQFIYWVTLDSHLPLMASGLHSCGTGVTKISDEGVCTWLNAVNRTLNNVANLAIDPSLPLTEFIIVGDHAPPFVVPTARMQFDNKYVPYIHLVPRNAFSDWTLASSPSSERGGQFKATRGQASTPHSD